MNKNFFQFTGSELLKKPGDPYTCSRSEAPGLFISGDGGLGSAARQTREDRQLANLEPMEIPQEPAPIEEKPKEPVVVLSEGAWNLSETCFQEEADVSVKVSLPPGKEHLTRIEAELYAKRTTGPELISRAEGHAQSDGTAVITLPVYKPKAHEGEPVDYFLIFKHKLAKLLQPESLLRKISETALKSTDHQLVPGISFAKDTSFIRPRSAAGLKPLESHFKDWERKFPKGKIIIFGHANPDEEDSKALSERRAESAFAFINNNADTWDRFYQLEKWGLIALQQILLDLGHYHGKADNQDGPVTRAAFKAIQKKTGLPESGKEDTATRKAIFMAYMKGKYDIKLDASRFRTVAGHSWMGCSNFNRAKEGEAPSPENRRVVFVLINESKFFPVNFPCQDGDQTACQTQCKKVGKRNVVGNKCLFYDGLLKEKKASEAKQDEDEQKLHDVPWMIKAEQEAKKWRGETEGIISKSINYHKEVGVDLSDLNGKSHAWCSSFVKYCLKEAGFQISSPPSRARSFLDDPNFVKIEMPVFGAIAVIATHHVCFVYADDKKSEKLVVLGGNQSDQINFMVFHEKISYFLPKTFDASMHTIPVLEEKTAAQLNSEFGILAHAKIGDTTR
ncbi:MAG: TIGR02594 family protein [Fibrobacteria bacterium]